MSDQNGYTARWMIRRDLDHAINIDRGLTAYLNRVLPQLHPDAPKTLSKNWLDDDFLRALRERDRYGRVIISPGGEIEAFMIVHDVNHKTIFNKSYKDSFKESCIERLGVKDPEQLEKFAHLLLHDLEDRLSWSFDEDRRTIYCEINEYNDVLLGVLRQRGYTAIPAQNGQPSLQFTYCVPEVVYTGPLNESTQSRPIAPPLFYNPEAEIFSVRIPSEPFLSDTHPITHYESEHFSIRRDGRNYSFSSDGNISLSIPVDAQSDTAIRELVFEDQGRIIASACGLSGLQALQTLASLWRENQRKG